ncbi:MAG: hypothetical protein ACI9KE_000823 [Polyangiales bacterium]|jgi:hypothetical protein
MRMALSLLAFCLLINTTSDAQAQGHHIQGLRPEVHAGIGFQGFLSAGFDLEFAIVPDGFLRGMDDELALAAGFDLLFADFGRYHDRDDPRGVGFAPNLTAQWNIYLSDKWSVFPEAGFTVLILTEGTHRYYRRHGRGGRAGYVDAVVGVGARLHMGRRFALVFRLGYPFGAQIGLNF